MPNQISPTQWGARINYDTKDWTPWNPDKWVIHYGGGAVSGYNDGPDREMAVLRAWEWYHLNGRGWYGIAYNYAIGNSGNLYRLRGEQRSGATSGDEDQDGIPENHEARAVVFILGGSQTPSEAALRTFSEFWASDPMRVIGHRDSTQTSCPGDKLYQWIQEGGYDMSEPIDPRFQAAFDWAIREGIYSGDPSTGEPRSIQRMIVYLHRYHTKLGGSSGIDSTARTRSQQALDLARQIRTKLKNLY